MKSRDQSQGGSARAQIGGSGVRLRGIVLDFWKSQALELGDEFAKTSGIVQQRAQAFGLGRVQRARDGSVVDLAGPSQGPCSCGGSPWQRQPVLPQRVLRSTRLPGSGRPKVAISAVILTRRRSIVAGPTRLPVRLVIPHLPA